MLDFAKELTRRKVWLFGGIYLALGWILLQVAIAVETTLSLPGWVDQIALVLLGLGFPVALLLAWAQESQGESQGQNKSSEETTSPGEAHEPGQNRPGFSIAVLPFDDLSPEGTFAENADGISEDVLTQLSYFGTLKVSARNSSFAYKGTSTDIRNVGAQLNVRFVLEGSFRTIGDNVRITAQLINALTGDHLWSRNFDHPLGQLDASMDDTVDALSGGVSAVLLDHEIKRLGEQPISSLSADDLTTIARYRVSETTESRLLEAETYLKTSLDMRPNHGRTLALMAQVQSGLTRHGSGDKAERRQLAETFLAKAKATGKPDQDTLLSFGITANIMDRTADLDFYAEQLREIAPKHPGTWAVTSFADSMAGNFEAALASVRRAMSLTSLRGPHFSTMQGREAGIHLILRDYQEAEACARKSLAINADPIARMNLAIALVMQDRIQEATSEMEGLKNSLSQELTVDSAKLKNYDLFGRVKNTEPFIEALRLAGLK